MSEQKEEEPAIPEQALGKIIYKISSDLPTFKTLEFYKGLNILVAEKSPEATQRQTRNGAGKTSLIEIVHFLLGGDCDKRSIFKTNELIRSSFSVDFLLGEEKINVERSGSKPSTLRLRGDLHQLPVTFQSRFEGAVTISNDEWKRLLMAIMFPTSSDNEDSSALSFRSIFPYFARQANAGGFMRPQKYFARQSLGSEQVALTFLVGLDWTIPAAWQSVRDREMTLKQLRKAVQEGALGREIGSSANLRTQLTIAEESARKLRAQLATFRVHNEYYRLEEEASELTRQIAELSDDSTLDRQYLIELDLATTEEKAPAQPDLERLYAEVGVALPNTAVRRFAEVSEFHASIVRNRRSYLEQEILEVRSRIRSRDSKKAKLDQRRAEVMAILETHGALEQFRKLQSELNRREAEAESIRQRFEAALALESTKSELKMERARLSGRLRQDHQEQEIILREAILSFEEVSSSLYEKAGNLTVDPSENGPAFEIGIHGDRSAGIANMQIFCFDMMLMQLAMRRGVGPRFIIHDSHLFDGVDERQVGKALQIGSALADDLGFQYIVTMNTDDLPQDLPPGFSLEKYILPVQLTDTEDGGLFGIPF
jgi:uncharacterized protein YydD (DUF2326 family)